MTVPTIDAMLTKWVADGELPDIPGGWTIPRLVDHIRRETLREAREAVAAQSFMSIPTGDYVNRDDVLEDIDALASPDSGRQPFYHDDGSLCPDWGDHSNHGAAVRGAGAASPAPTDATVLLRSLWDAEAGDGFQVSDLFDENDPLAIDVERAIAQ